MAEQGQDGAGAPTERKRVDVADLERAVLPILCELVGTGSTCWEKPEGAGVFQSERAAAVAERAASAVVERLLGLVTSPVKPASPVEVLKAELADEASRRVRGESLLTEATALPPRYPVHAGMRDQIERAFGVHFLDEEQRASRERVLQAGKEFALLAAANAPGGREFALFLTNLEAATFWLEAAIVRGGR